MSNSNHFPQLATDPAPVSVIILAAGIGQRLGPKCKDKPKCLLEFGGRHLLHRHLLALVEYPVTEILLITGFNEAAIKAELKKIAIDTPVHTRYNPDFTRGSIVSLWQAKDSLQSGSDIILMDADVLYDPHIIRALFQSHSANNFLLDRDFEQGDEPVKLCIRNGIPIDFGKQIDKDLQFDFQGESVGFFRFSTATAQQLAGIIQDYIDQNRLDEPYEEAVRDLLHADPGAFSFTDITGLPWIEIDFPEDIERAENQILKKIEELNH